MSRPHLGHGTTWHRTWDFVWVWLCGVGIVMVAVWGNGWLRAALSYSRLVWLGKISYGLYMYHEVALWARERLFDPGSPGSPTRTSCPGDRDPGADDRPGGGLVLRLRAPILGAQAGVDAGSVAAGVIAAGPRGYEPSTLRGRLPARARARLALPGEYATPRNLSHRAGRKVSWERSGDKNRRQSRPGRSGRRRRQARFRPSRPGRHKEGRRSIPAPGDHRLLVSRCGFHPDGAAAPAVMGVARAYMAKILLRTRNVGSPQASTSCDSGSARQSFRNCAIVIDDMRGSSEVRIANIPMAAAPKMPQALAELDRSKSGPAPVCSGSRFGAAAASRCGLR